MFVPSHLWLLGFGQQFRPPGSLVGNPESPFGSTDADTFHRLRSFQLEEELAWLHGGYGVRWMFLQWAEWWRAQYYEADKFVTECGFGTRMAREFEQRVKTEVAQPFRINFRPYFNQRLERVKLMIRSAS